MKLFNYETVHCPHCSESHEKAESMVDDSSPGIPHITDCIECGEPFSVLKLTDNCYEVSWA